MGICNSKTNDDGPCRITSSITMDDISTTHFHRPVAYLDDEVFQDSHLKAMGFLPGHMLKIKKRHELRICNNPWAVLPAINPSATSSLGDAPIVLCREVGSIGNSVKKCIYIYIYVMYIYIYISGGLFLPIL